MNVMTVLAAVVIAAIIVMGGVAVLIAGMIRDEE